ncbi:hypothetical protein SLEP1_g56779 [Rubroshorea leprosula]|uniref:Uncharacterized protein n=1 Tax=Rubroshorea leprosula TaxID=152421 RepID=A0AAV5MJA6_9ROSI|nr:hypothetical protein SLEP1_g56779 [Rubroshorea leprosula]
MCLIAPVNWRINGGFLVETTSDVPNKTNSSSSPRFSSPFSLPDLVVHHPSLARLTDPGTPQIKSQSLPQSAGIWLEWVVLGYATGVEYHGARPNDFSRREKETCREHKLGQI